MVLDEARLTANAKAAIADQTTEVHVSVASVWEMAIKVGLGKWPEAAALVANFEREAGIAGVDLLPIQLTDVRTAGLMQVPHRDPFDRLLAAQASNQSLTLVTADRALKAIAPNTLW